MIILDDLALWDGRSPVALVAPASSAAARRDRLRDLAAAALGLSPEAVAIRHAEDRAPVLERPSGATLHLSSASRAGLAALAVARQPVGVDVERVEPDREIPWNVLHPGEASALRGLPDRDRTAAFARLWACKEAYLKALGLGVAREPDSFQVRLGAAPSIHDPGKAGRARLVSVMRRDDGGSFAVALVVVSRYPSTGSVATS